MVERYLNEQRMGFCDSMNVGVVAPKNAKHFCSGIDRAVLSIPHADSLVGN